MEFKKILTYILFSVLFLVPIILAETPAQSSYYAVQNGFSQVTGIPVEYLKFPELLYYLVIPTLAIVSITMAFLKEFDLFKKTPQVNYIIALSVGLISLVSSFTYVVVSVTLRVMGAFAFAAFAIIFFTGVGFFAYKTYMDQKIKAGYAGSPYLTFRIYMLQSKINKLERKNPRTPEEEREMLQLKSQLNSLKEKLNQSKIIENAKKSSLQQSKLGDFPSA